MQEQTNRQFWMGVLARAQLESLEAHWASLPEQPDYRKVRAPEVGLAMVQGRAGSGGQAFNLGEMTLSRCVVQLDDGTAGFGYVRGRSKRHAELAAVFDALLQNDDRYAALMSDCIQPLHAQWTADRNALSRDVAGTKVDFFTLVRGEA
ncbi:MAG: phosphonate C-P lyase system protein PhnG [Alteromonadaceae bacterium]|nr:phosphonate C-P lyase system protein PhnG [Alteromonadaceae bacterium]MBH83916.1 phosphonate C-P lyase system protein PhnG [Alteromonadaceae bacterium]|tara:strand:+ start:498 stop:944 length:447 start_codon:yes stop_codon:yes gene_type:complete